MPSERSNRRSSRFGSMSNGFFYLTRRKKRQKKTENKSEEKRKEKKRNEEIFNYYKHTEEKRRVTLAFSHSIDNNTFYELRTNFYVEKEFDKSNKTFRLLKHCSIFSFWLLWLNVRLFHRFSMDETNNNWSCVVLTFRYFQI